MHEVGPTGNLLAGRLDTVVLAHCRELLGRTGRAEEARVERRHVRAQPLRAVALRVDGDVDHLEILARRAEHLARAREVGERGGTDVGAEGVAEAERHDLAAVLAEPHVGAVGAAQRELGRGARRREGPGAQLGGAGGRDRRREDPGGGFHSRIGDGATFFTKLSST